MNRSSGLKCDSNDDPDSVSLTRTTVKASFPSSTDLQSLIENNHENEYKFLQSLFHGKYPKIKISCNELTRNEYTNNVDYTNVYYGISITFLIFEENSKQKNPDHASNSVFCSMNCWLTVSLDTDILDTDRISGVPVQRRSWNVFGKDSQITNATTGLSYAPSNIFDKSLDMEHFGRHNFKQCLRGLFKYMVKDLPSDLKYFLNLHLNAESNEFEKLESLPQ